MRYVSSRIDKKTNDDIYRIYITNALKILTTNTAKFAGGSELTKSYHDIISDDAVEEQQQQDDEQEAQNVISNIKSKLSNLKGR